MVLSHFRCFEQRIIVSVTVIDQDGPYLDAISGSRLGIRVDFVEEAGFFTPVTPITPEAFATGGAICEARILLGIAAEYGNDRGSGDSFARFAIAA